MKILILDNYDSFTYNLAHAVRSLGYTDLDIARNDKIGLEEIEKYDKIILSPGPGIPSESGILLALIEKYAPSKCILGICLGEQAIGEAFGARLENMSEVFHGIDTKIRVIEKDPIFEGIEEEFDAGRYHSWIVSSEGLPQELRVTATDEHGNIMAIAHRDYDVRGVQFHPESVLTPQGVNILKNWLES